MSFPRYPKYKDSGVEWLGAVPEHWGIDRFKRSTTVCRNGIWGNEAQGDANDIQCVRVADFDRGRMTVNDDVPTIRNVTEIERKDRTLSRGNLLLEKSGGGELQPVGFVVLFDHPEPSVCSNFVAKVELATNMSPSYWRYCHAAAYAVRLNVRSIKQTSGIQNLDQSQYLDERAPFPPFPEQTAIASFLDAETSKIDALIAEQRRLIELLKEKRQAVISHAVTKGLNPDAPMKPSGIEWLGDVPEHWSVAAVRFRYTVQLGKMLDTEKITGKHLQPYLRVFDVQWGAINVEELPQMDFDPSVRDRFRLAPGDLLINEGGSYPGRSAIWNGELEECYFQKALHRLRPCDATTDTTRFFFYTMAWATARGVFTAGGNESTIEHLPAEKFRKYRFAFPPISEQFAIADFLDNELGNFETLTTEATSAIALLQERRTALISAAVTGKIDVREFANVEAA